MIISRIEFVANTSPVHSLKYELIGSISVPPRGTFFLPDRDLETQEYLFCLTSANPSPEYTFYREGRELQKGPSSGLKLEEDMVSSLNYLRIVKQTY